MCILLGGELPLGALRAYGWAIYKGDLKGGAFFVGLPDLSKALRDRAMDWQQKKTPGAVVLSAKTFSMFAMKPV